MVRQLFIVRHAHRDTGTDRLVDSGLTERGRRQAKCVRKFFARVSQAKRPIMMSSPAIRCMETLQPYAARIERKIEIADFLFEQREGESWTQFERRVAFFITSWQRSKQRVTIVCSHSDWISAATFALLGVGIKLRKGGVIEIIENEKQLELGCVIQSFEALF